MFLVAWRSKMHTQSVDVDARTRTLFDQNFPHERNTQPTEKTKMECPVVVCETISCVLLRVNVKPCRCFRFAFENARRSIEDIAQTHPNHPCEYAYKIHIYRRDGIRMWCLVYHSILFAMCTLVEPPPWLQPFKLKTPSLAYIMHI